MATACLIYIAFFVAYMFGPSTSAWVVVLAWVLVASLGDAL